MNLDELAIGDQVKILGYLPSNRHYRKKLLIMGLTPGSFFTLIGVAPLGDPIQISTRGASLCLRKNEAKIMKLEKIIK